MINPDHNGYDDTPINMEELIGTLDKITKKGAHIYIFTSNGEGLKKIVPNNWEVVERDLNDINT